MFICKKCGYEFSDPKKIYETHGLESSPYEELFVCPACKSQSISEKMVTHCRCCGAKLKDSNAEYCSESCKNRGERLREIEQRKRKVLTDSPLSEIVRRVKAYNKKHNTNYSYGQYVAIVIPNERAEKKCKKKRKNI